MFLREALTPVQHISIVPPILPVTYSAPVLMGYTQLNSEAFALVTGFYFLT